jgi:hypothetical protein
MFLDYFSLAIGLIGLLLAFYAFIFIHDIPYEIAKKSDHPHAETIHVGCWLSLFTLHALWPLLFLWAKASPRALKVNVEGSEEVIALRLRVENLEKQLACLVTPATEAAHHD